MFDALDWSMRSSPKLGNVELPSTISVDSLLSAASSAYTKGHVRFLDVDSSIEGHGTQWLANSLGREVDILPASAMREILERRLCTLAVQSLDQFDTQIAIMAEDIRQRTGRRVSVTGFFSPARSQGTSIHYDKSDVFVVQVSGVKRWSVYEPIDVEPNMRTPYRAPANVIDQLVEAGNWDLKPGNTLFLPTGWIHDVKNDSDELCLHLSFVISSDSLLSVFGNVMTEAYAKLTDDPKWRTRLAAGDLHKHEVAGQINEMLVEFVRVFSSTLADEPMRFCDHVLNSTTGAARRSAARATISVLDDVHEDVQLKWIDGHHRAVRNGSKLEVSTDGAARYGVSPQLYSHCMHRRILWLSELSNVSQVPSDEVVDFVATMVRDLGLIALEPLE